MTDPNGTIADIAYMLAQCNDMMKDMIWQEGNLPLGHKVSANVALPQGTWRNAGQGVAASKPLFQQYEFGIGELVDYSMVDKSTALLNGNLAKFRLTQDQTHIQGLSQQWQRRFYILTSNNSSTIYWFYAILQHSKHIKRSIS